MNGHLTKEDIEIAYKHMQRSSTSVMSWTVCPPTTKIQMSPFQPPVPQNMTVFGDRVFKMVTMLKWDQVGGALSHMTNVLTRREEDTYTHRGKDPVKTGRKRAIPKAAREALEESNPANVLILDIQPPEFWENKFLLFKPPTWYFVMLCHANQYGLKSH